MVFTGGTSGSSHGGASNNQSSGPACGDGSLNQTNERCDDGNRNNSDGCSAECRIEADYFCETAGKPCTTTKICGDGLLVGDEECDDGATRDHDGCTASCKREPGYDCRLPGAPCAEVCGDSIVTGSESCDDGNTENNDGCSSTCQIESDATSGTDGRPSYWNCANQGEKCTRATCGNGTREGAEPCDDGNDRPGDGCSPNCEVEPHCDSQGCTSQCGDGIILPGEAEECDDGNTKDNDGCSSSCKKESGYSCQQVTGALPSQLTIPIVYRDFVGGQRAIGNAPIHPDFDSSVGADGGTLGLVKDTLNSNGLPELTGLCVGAPVNGLLTGATDAECPRHTIFGSSTSYAFNQMSSTAAFAQWYQDDKSVNRTIVSRLCLKSINDTGTYAFDSATDSPTDCEAVTTCAEGHCWFLPLNNQGFVKEGLEVDNLQTPDLIWGGTDPASLKGNFSFTSVVRTWFIYRGGEQLDFSGDDDVWVFINGKLAVDLGGLHSIENGGVTLDEAKATALGLSSGRVYEMVLFHAERYGYGSNFKLTLSGFVTAKSECSPECGDGVRAGRESCDNGKDNVPVDAKDAYGRCTVKCELGPRCGDGTVQKDNGEECDTTSARTLYTDKPGEGCTPSCKFPGYCGDGVMQTGFEECDDGDKNSDSATEYGKCTKECRLAPHCGDGITNGNEQCDAGENNGNGNCSIGCQLQVLQ